MKKNTENLCSLSQKSGLSVRYVLLGLCLSLAATACMRVDKINAPLPKKQNVKKITQNHDSPNINRTNHNFEKIYASFEDSGFVLPTIPYNKIKPQFLRQKVSYTTKEKPGSIIISLKEKFLYFVLPDGQAMRYGIGVGRDGFRWSGRDIIGYKKEWPIWTPPAAMIQRMPELKKWEKGYPAGLKNPLGARAMYLYENNKDTEYRIHGSPEWWSIGTAASSGCIRMINQDVIDLYSRVERKATVIVK